MGRTLDDARRWASFGTQVCRDAILTLDEDTFAEPSLLPGWTRKHLVAHLAANAEAVRNLATWAATGVPTPMYSSLEQRASCSCHCGNNSPARARMVSSAAGATLPSGCRYSTRCTGRPRVAARG